MPSDYTYYSHGGEVYDKDISWDFSVNTNPLGMPESVKSALISSIQGYELYPDIKNSALRSAISKKYHINNPEHIVPGNGASELIMALVNAIYPKGALVTSPTFSGYERAFRAWDTKVSHYALSPENDFLLTESIISSIKKRMLFLCNPNNPTGRLIPRDILQKIIDYCENNRIFLVIDESFMELSDSGISYSVLEEASYSQYVIGIMSLTKTYSLAGLRSGFIVTGNDEIISRLLEILPEWNVSIPSQVAAITALMEEDNYLESSLRLIQKERERLTNALTEKGYHPFPSETNYILFKGNPGLYTRLLEREILIRDCSNFEGLSTGYFRICVGTEDKNKRFIKSLPPH